MGSGNVMCILLFITYKEGKEILFTTTDKRQKRAGVCVVMEEVY